MSINYSAPVETVIEILEQLANDHSHVLNEPAPEAFLETINCDHGYLRFTLYYWHQMPSPREHLIINSELQIEMIERFSHQGIRLANPTQDIIMHRGLAAA